MISPPEGIRKGKDEGKMKKQVVDERIRNASNALLAKFYWVMLVLQAMVLAVKLLFVPEWICWALDAVILAAGLGVMAVLRSLRGLWGRKDEALREMDNSVLSTAYGTMLWVVLIGSMLLIFGNTENALWYGPSLLPLLITSCIYTVLVMKRGLILWGGEARKGNAKKRLRRSVPVGALFYGAVMGAQNCFRNGEFQPMGLVKVFLMALAWGLMFYGLMVLVINRGEKAANKTVEEQEADAEE